VTPSTEKALRWCASIQKKARRNRLLTLWAFALQFSLVWLALTAMGYELWRPAPNFRLFAIGGLALVAILTVVLSLVYRRRDRDPHEFAADIERNQPTFRSALVTSVEIGTQHEQNDAVASWVLEGLERQVEKGLHEIDPNILTRQARCGRSLRILLVTILLMSVAAGIHRDVVPHAFASLFHTQGPEDPVTLEVRKVSTVVESVVVEIQPPAYSDRRKRILPGFTGTLTCMKGTEITMRGQVVLAETEVLSINLPRPDEEDLVQNLPIKNGQFEFKHVVLAGGPFSFEAQGGGTRFLQKVPYRIELEPDNAPRVRILFPEKDEEVNLDDDAELTFETRDDFGIQAVRRIARIQGAGIEDIQGITVPTADDLFTGKDTFAFVDLGARPGDTVEILYEVEDTDTISGPKTTRSVPRKFKIFSADERHSNMLERENKLLEKLLLRLADRLERVNQLDNAANSQKTFSAYKKLVRGDASFLKTFQLFMHDLSEDSLTSDLVRSSLEQMLHRQRELHQRDTSNIAAIKPHSTQNPHRVKSATRLDPKIVDTFESDVLALDELILQQRQDQLAADAGTLQRMEEDLRNLLANMRNGASPAQMRQAMNTIDRLEQKIAKMRQQMRDMAQKMPYENFNPDAMLRNQRKVGLSDVDSGLQEIRKLLREGKMEEALKLAEALEKDIQQLGEQMRKGLVRPRTSQGTEVAKELQKEARKLTQLAKEQEGLMKETEALDRSKQRALEKKLKQGGFEKELERARKRVAELGQQLRRIPRYDLHKYDQEALDKALNKLERLGERLNNSDLPKAAEEAQKLANQLQQLGMEMKLSSRREKRHKKRNNMRKSAGTCNGAGNELSELSKDLEDMMPEPKESLGKRGMRKARELGQRQSRLRKQAKQSAKRLQQAGKDFPALSRLLKNIVEDAEASMNRAGGRLRQGQPNQAQPHQQEATERLRQAEKEIENALKPNGREGGVEMTGVDRNKERVEIPGEEAFEVPHSFRDLIMRTMKETVPERYDRALEQYFRELAK
jgi:hypothetical protein